MSTHSPSEKPNPILYSSAVSGMIEDGILHLTIANPPVNAISAAIREGLMQALDQAEIAADIHAITMSGAGKFFAAGADIKEFDLPPSDPTLPQVTARIEAATKPVIAAINGTALGGGCEIILACHYRIAVESAKFGLPEVKLGLIPGAGGTQRLPRLTGMVTALDMIGTGKTITAAQALEYGLIDQISAADSFANALRQAVITCTKTIIRRTTALELPAENANDIQAAADKIIVKARGRTAPAEAVRIVSLAATLPVNEALAEERATFLRLRQSDEAKALRHVFFAEREAGKHEALADYTARKVSVIGIAGTGLMGSGIAVAALAGGYKIIGYEQTADAAAAGHARITALLQKQFQSGRLSEAALNNQLANLSVSADITALSAADLVIEAVFDDYNVKSDLFRRLDGTVRADTIIATNTSYLNPDELAAQISNPERVVGMHFFSPAHIMRLLEVVNCARTAAEVLVTTLEVAKKLNKLATICGVCEGFIGNRIFSAYRREAEFMLEQGALPHEIDAALEDYGFAMGLFAVYDMAGLEIAWAKRRREASMRDPSAPYCQIADRLCEAGRFGQKSGKGWYIYPQGKRQIDPDITVLIEAVRTEKNITPRRFTAHNIISQLLNVMALEGEKLLSEGIAARASDIDLVLINGYGFPAHKGGPMFAAQHNKD
ncbi:3-hydroxyacyl-CoA dehydrogenase NAD-binding domain-containing protein [Pseudochrobactrum sp. MP213Fo]|uniref:3-hydroxyacyl-CoA dehydrogenase NAD-binding domain-containing protein n=1 Tax=Pseudochrobactrum sp. MP213Fo TaxID=3022250 RepID=UPI003BA31C08